MTPRKVQSEGMWNGPLKWKIVLVISVVAVLLFVIAVRTQPHPAPTPTAEVRLGRSSA